MDQDNRVVVLIDMDCFYCQVEEKLNPELKGKPIAVVQYNPWKGGGIIAVNYVARALGVTRHMRGDEAKEKCPEIHLPSVPCNNGKADIGTYREAGKEVARVLQRFTPLLERASIDEAYLDITAPVQERLKTLDVSSINTLMIPNTFALGYDSVEEFITDVHGYGNDSIEFDHEHSKRLLVGAVIVSEVRAAVYEETGFRCSAGIAHNKILAKLVCGINKPNKQTILPKHSVNILYSTLSIKKVKNLGGKFGYQVKDTLKITNMGELQTFSEKDLQNKFDEKDGTWLYNIARGIDLEPVQARFNPKSIGCCKNFKGKSALVDLDNLRKWLKVHGDEVDDRLEKDAIESNRTPKQMVVSFSTQLLDGRDVSSSRSYNFTADDQLCGDLFAAKALELVLDSTEGVKPKEGEANRKLKAPIKFLGISVGKFEDNSESKKTKKILDYFGAGSSNVTKIKDTTKHNETKGTTSDGKIAKVNDGKEYILNKFFQVTNKVKIKEETITDPQQTNDKKSIKTDPVIESTLDKQESFFTKFLSANKDTLRPTTPNCDVINCGENSNDSDYSSSTINNEINKSIALFDEDTQDISRVSKMRELLNNSKRIDTETDIQPGSVENIKDTRERKKHSPGDHKKPSPSGGQTFDCPECRKSLPKAMFETHADYHLALKLRDEERQQARKEKERNITKTVINTRNENVKKKKIDETADKSEQNREHKKHSPKKVSPPGVATFDCPECRKTIPKAMFETHADYHLALKLRDEERQQARKEKERNITKTATNTRKEEVKKKKTEESVNKNETASSIASFFVKLDDTVPTESCSECGKKVSIEKLAEHLDFHEAQKLSRELNNRAAPRYLMGSSVKRKRKTVSPVRKPKVPCNKSIESFFKS